MKKLLLSVIALGVLSSAAFASTGTTAPKVKLENKVVASKSSLKAVEEIKETKQGSGTQCTYTLVVMDGGRVVGKYHQSYYVWSNIWGGGSNYQSCAAWLKDIRAMYRQFLPQL
ncbi:MAG: hypothetical protein LBF27_34095 [Sphingobacterium sp.]|nr:hypothetical protein [Sphingobacterium sp.]